MPDLSDLTNELRDLEALTVLSEDDAERLNEILALQDQLFTDTLAEYAENEPILIRDSEFEEYAQDVAAGYIGPDDPMYPYINWEKWAEAMKQDYTEVEFAGDTYHISKYVTRIY